MILYKNMRYRTDSDHPNDDWVGDADYVVPDDSELAEKIKTLYPNFDFVFDDDGNIADVTATEPTEKLPEITLEQRVTATENAVEELISMIMGG